MKKALFVAFGTLVTVSSSVLAHSYLKHPVVRQSAFSVTGTFTESSNNGVSVGDYHNDGTIGPFNNPFLGRRPILMEVDAVFDYKLAYSYRLPNSETHVFASFDHYTNTDDVRSTGNVVNIGLHSSSTNPMWTSGHLEQRYREFRLGLCRDLPFTSRFMVNLTAFFEWDDLDRDLYEKAEQQIGQQQINYVQRVTQAEMEGWGFGVGAKVRAIPFKHAPRWGTFMGGKGILLWVSNDYSQYRGELSQSSDDYSFFPESSDSVVAKADVSFGIDYARLLNTDAGRFLLQIELGMRYMNMFNALKNGNTHFDPLWTSSSSGTAANLGFPNDWGRMGGFLTVKLGGANA